MNHYLEPRAFFLYAGLVLLAFSAWSHVRGKEKTAFYALLGSGFFLFLSATLLYPVLSAWDERFHALVSKNLMQHPLMPTLYDETPVPMAYDWWARSHIWLHKQPLFMWQIALSYKIFGVNEFALRLPSLVLSVCTVVAVYRSGKILRNAAVGYGAAFLLVTSFYWYELVSGWQHTDHNDVSFFAYVSLSIWSWLEYLHTGKKRWIVLTGIFSGFAILCKWLVGLLVYAAWGTYAVSVYRLQVKKYLGLFIALLITAVVALPWQWLIFRWYPAEAEQEYALNLRHFTEPFEGHGGDAMYHFDMMDQLYGIWVFYALLPALFLMVWRARNRVAGIALAVALVIVYVFFTIVPTKMPSFTAVAILPVFVSLGFLGEYLEELLGKIRLQQTFRVIAMSILVTAFGIARIDLNLLNEKHDFFKDPRACTRGLIENKKIFQQLDVPANAVLFNVAGLHYIDAMFYTGLPAYGFIPSQEQYEAVREKNRTVVVFKAPADSLPAYLLDDKKVMIIPAEIKRCE